MGEKLGVGDAVRVGVRRGVGGVDVGVAARGLGVILGAIGDDITPCSAGIVGIQADKKINSPIASKMFQRILKRKQQGEQQHRYDQR